ncbi:cAMP-responsive element-binding protein-like 2 [Glandiceps talaboti]
MNTLKDDRRPIPVGFSRMKGGFGNPARKNENKAKRVPTGKVKKTGSGRRGRKPSKIDQKAKLERSRQSARECRARKKVRYQQLEELVVEKEKDILKLRDELETYRKWCKLIDDGILPPEIKNVIRLSGVSEKANKATSSHRKLDENHTVMQRSKHHVHWEA